jgi:hypothetical protein
MQERGNNHRRSEVPCEAFEMIEECQDMRRIDESLGCYSSYREKILIAESTGWSESKDHVRSIDYVIHSRWGLR